MKAYWLDITSFWRAFHFTYLLTFVDTSVYTAGMSPLWGAAGEGIKNIKHTSNNVASIWYPIIEMVKAS